MKKNLSHFEKPSFFHFITEKCIFYLKYTLDAIKIMIDKKNYIMLILKTIFYILISVLQKMLFYYCFQLSHNSNYLFLPQFLHCITLKQCYWNMMLCGYHCHIDDQAVHCFFLLICRETVHAAVKIFNHYGEVQAPNGFDPDVSPSSSEFTLQNARITASFNNMGLLKALKIRKTTVPVHLDFAK